MASILVWRYEGPNRMLSSAERLSMEQLEDALTEGVEAPGASPRNGPPRAARLLRSTNAIGGHADGKGREGGVANVSTLPSGSRTCASVE